MTGIDLNTLTLDVGEHDSPDEGMCLMEAASLFAGESFTDAPACVSTRLGDFGRRLNDNLPTELRQRLVPLIPRLVCTRDDGLDDRRGYLALDWLIRGYFPAWFELAAVLNNGLRDTVTSLRLLPPIVDLASARPAGQVVKTACARAREQRTVRAGYQRLIGVLPSALLGYDHPALLGHAVSTVVMAAPWELSEAQRGCEIAEFIGAGGIDRAAYEPVAVQLRKSAIELFTAMIRPT